MSNQLTATRSPQVLTIERDYGPPLTASELIFRMPESTQGRVLHYNVNVFSAVNGILLSSISLHDTAGNIIFLAGLMPLLNVFIFGQATTRAIAGPEQGRVPFFTPDVLVGTIPKDLYALPGYEFRFNNIGGLAGRSAEVTIYLSQGNE